MAKSVKSLSGADKDAYLAHVVAAELGDRAGAAEAIAQRLGGEVTRVWVKLDALAGGVVASEETSDAGAGEHAGDVFDPFSPNVIVVLRREGRDKAISALLSVKAAANLRRLAREQQLGIDPELVDADEIRAAIVAAAEQRVRNRRAAAR